MFHFIYFLLGFSQLLYADKFSIKYAVPVDSVFKFERQFNSVKSGQTQLGTFSFKNNTADGFKLTVRSESGGRLAPVDTGDGTDAIPYTLTLRPQTRRLDNAFQEDLTPLLPINQAVPVIYMVGQPSLASYAHYELIITIDASYDELALSGDYRDTLYLTYHDL